MSERVPHMPAIFVGHGSPMNALGGDYARTHSNRLMRLRVALQAVAVLLLVGGMVWKATSGG